MREHLQQDTACVKRENQTLLSGFTKEQERVLRSRKRVRPGTSEADKWREMYRVLFPDDDFTKMPCPCKNPQCPNGTCEHVSSC